MRKYLLCLFVLGILVTGCEKTGTYDNYTLQGHVYWGSKEAVGDSVEINYWSINGNMFTDIVITNSSGKYTFKDTYAHYYAYNMPLKVRAKDSANVWSSFQYDSISPNETVTIDFHL